VLPPPVAEHRRRRIASAEHLLAAVQHARRARCAGWSRRCHFSPTSLFSDSRCRSRGIRDLQSTTVQFLPSRAAPLAPRPISSPGGTFPPPERQCCAAPLSPLPPVRSFAVSHRRSCRGSTSDTHRGAPLPLARGAPLLTARRATPDLGRWRWRCRWGKLGSPLLLLQEQLGHLGGHPRGPPHAPVGP
jgi:hypothetical protein